MKNTKRTLIMMLAICFVGAGSANGMEDRKKRGKAANKALTFGKNMQKKGHKRIAKKLYKIGGGATGAVCAANLTKNPKKKDQLMREAENVSYVSPRKKEALKYREHETQVKIGKLEKLRENINKDSDDPYLMNIKKAYSKSIKAAQEGIEKLGQEINELESELQKPTEAQIDELIGKIAKLLEPLRKYENNLVCIEAYYASVQELIKFMAKKTFSDFSWEEACKKAEEKFFMGDRFKAIRPTETIESCHKKFENFVSETLTEKGLHEESIKVRLKKEREYDRGNYNKDKDSIDYKQKNPYWHIQSPLSFILKTTEEVVAFTVTPRQLEVSYQEYSSDSLNDSSSSSEETEISLSSKVVPYATKKKNKRNSQKEEWTWTQTADSLSSDESDYDSDSNSKLE